MNLRALRVLLVLALLVVGVGLYRGWFVVSNRSGGKPGNDTDVHISVDSDKMHSDAESVKAKTTELTEKAGEEARELRDQAKKKLNSKGQ